MYLTVTFLELPVSQGPSCGSLHVITKDEPSEAGRILLLPNQ